MEVKHNAVKLQNLDGSKADTQNVNNVYPFNREDDKALQQIEEGLLPPQSSGHVEFQVGQCFVYDLSEGKDVDFRIIKVVEVADEDNFVAQYLAAYPSRKHFSKRPHFPVYRDKSGAETYTNEPRPHLIGGEATVLVNRSEIRFPPFALTGHSYIFAVGDYSDGELQVYDGDQPINYDIRSRILKFDGQTPHGVARIGSGVRISFVVYKRNA